MCQEIWLISMFYKFFNISSLYKFYLKLQFLHHSVSLLPYNLFWNGNQTKGHRKIYQILPAGDRAIILYVTYDCFIVLLEL